MALPQLPPGMTFGSYFFETHHKKSGRRKKEYMKPKSERGTKRYD